MFASFPYINFTNYTANKKKMQYLFSLFKGIFCKFFAFVPLTDAYKNDIMYVLSKKEQKNGPD